MSLEFTAAKAKSLVNEFENFINEKSKRDFLELIERIKTQATEGRRSLVQGTPLTLSFKQQLEIRGFIIKTTYDQRDGDYTTISW